MTKRFGIVLMLAGVLGLCLSGCSGKDNADPAADNHAMHAHAASNDDGTPAQPESADGTADAAGTTADGPNEAEPADLPAYTIDAEIERREDGYYLHVTTDLKLSTENYGGAHVEGEGHIHLYINGSLIGPILDEQPVYLDRLTEGPNKVRVALAKNNHTLITGASKTLEFEAELPAADN